MNENAHFELYHNGRFSSFGKTARDLQTAQRSKKCAHFRIFHRSPYNHRFDGCVEPEPIPETTIPSWTTTSIPQELKPVPTTVFPATVTTHRPKSVSGAPTISESGRPLKALFLQLLDEMVIGEKEISKGSKSRDQGGQLSSPTIQDDSMCIPTVQYAVMLSSTLLAFILVTLLAVIACIKTFARIWQQSTYKCHPRHENRPTRVYNVKTIPRQKPPTRPHENPLPPDQHYRDALQAYLSGYYK